MSGQELEGVPQCSFFVRTKVRSKPVGYTYEPISPTGRAQLSVELRVPPAVGDLIFIGGANHRVIDRAWTIPDYGSPSWPYTSAEPRPRLDIIVERGDGPFLDEVSP